MTNLQLLAVGFHNSTDDWGGHLTFPVSVSTTVIFFNGSNCQLLSVGNIYIGMNHDSRHQYFSPSQLI